MTRSAIVEMLVHEGKRLFLSPPSFVQFTKHADSDRLRVHAKSLRIPTRLRVGQRRTKSHLTQLHRFLGRWMQLPITV
jgi:hypothetical protein